MTYKIIFLGDSYVGKTSFIKTYMSNKPSPEAKTVTVGLDISSKDILHKGQSIRIQLWDVTGGHRFTKMIQSYGDNIVGAMVLYDVTEPDSFKSILGWCEAARRLSSDSPLIICGYKIDGIRAVSYHDAIRMAQRLNCSYTEATSTSVSSVEKAMRSLLMKIKFEMKDVKSPLEPEIKKKTNKCEPKCRICCCL